jgi:hypothetical protein
MSGGKTSPNTLQSVQWRRCGWRGWRAQPRHAAADGSFVGKTWLSGYEPTRVVLSQHKLLVWGPCLTPLRRASWTMALLHVARTAWVLRSGLAGLWALEKSPFRRQGGESQGLQLFISIIGVSYTLSAFRCAGFLHTVDELTCCFHLKERGGRQLASQYDLKSAQLSSRRREWTKTGHDAEARLNQSQHRRITGPHL